MKSSWMIALIALGSLLGSPIASVQASSIFDQQEVDQKDFVLMATPYQGGSKHQLTIIGQASDERDCWSEQGNQPTAITPLLLTFDFSGICTRAVDGNGYSIRMDGKDQYLAYRPRIIEANGEFQLIASPTRPGLSPQVIARSKGTPQSFSKLVFQPGWRLTKRRYEDKVLGHLYLTYDSTAQPLAQTSQSIPLSVTPTDQPTETEVSPSKPAASKPLASQPAASQPAANQPTISKPATSQPVAVSSSPAPSGIYLRQVSALYREVTGTAIDADTASRYARLLRNGATLALLRADIADGETVTAALKQMYQELKGTTLPAAELKQYRDRLKEGWSLAEVEWDVMQSSAAQLTIQSSSLQE